MLARKKKNIRKIFKKNLHSHFGLLDFASMKVHKICLYDIPIKIIQHIYSVLTIFT